MRRIAPLLSQRAWRALAFSVPLATGLGGYVAYCEKQQPPSLLASPSPSSMAINDTVTNAQRFDVQYPEAHKALTDLLGERYVLDEQVLEQHGKEMSGYSPRANPQAVVYPETTEEVQKVILLCKKHKISIVPYAAGTSVEGHTTAPRGGLTVNCTRMTKVINISKEDMDCVVQPGVGWVQLNEQLAPYGLFLGVDPAPGACIGGMCATCCSGTNAVKYGTMKNQVLNLTVVLSDGTIVKTGQRARKSSAGYNLAGLFVGSEGTLGIITEVTLRLRNVPETVSVAMVAFDSVKDAANATIEILQQGIDMGAIELLDEEMVKCCNEYSGTKLQEKPFIFFKFTGTKVHVEYDLERVRAITAKHTPHEYQWAKSDEERDRIWGMRKHAFWAAQHWGEKASPNVQLMSTDVAVPISQLAKAIDDTKKELKESFLFAPIVGHVGDGNYHVCICFDPSDPRQVEEAHRLNENMVYRAIALDGTCTGEHGVGIGKKKYLIPERGEGSVELMKRIKRALDPDNMFNPGKVVDP